MPLRLNDILRAAGYEAEAVLRTWKDRGWLEINEPDRSRYKVRIGKTTVGLVMLGAQEVRRVRGTLAEMGAGRAGEK